MKKLLFVAVTLLIAVTGVFAQAKVDRKGSKSAETAYTCPMHPEVYSLEAGKCPKCGMELVSCPKRPEIDRRGSKSASLVYYCPMHPSVKSDKPGKCPMCGATLVKKTSGKDKTMKDSATMKGKDSTGMKGMKM